VEVILLEKMRNLGSLGQKVKVKPGFARNYLIPQGKAVYATKINLEKFELRRVELEQKAAEKTKSSQDKLAQLQALTVVTITAKAGEEGKLFGSIGTRDIANAITQAGVEIEKRSVQLPEGTIRQIGSFDILIDLDSDMTTIVKIQVVGEG